MNCNFNNNCNCNSCKRFVKTINVTLFGNVLLLTIPAKNYFNNEEVCICVAQKLPDCIGTDITVNVQLGNAGPQYPLQICGKHVYADQIRCRKLYCTRVATDTKTFNMIGNGNLCCTEHVFPPILPLTVSSEAEEEIAEISIQSDKIEKSATKPKVNE